MSSPSLAEVIVKDQNLAGLPYREVRFADLDIDTQEGLDALNTRIASAVRTVCGRADNRILTEVATMHSCREASLQRAFMDRDAIIAARLAARGDPVRMAALTSLPVSR
jgi:UrcA family protein